jgi:hypothetical protein
MTVIITTTKTRPSSDINFRPNNLYNRRSTWSGYLNCISVLFSEDTLTKTTITRWESRQHFENPSLTEEQLLMNNKFIQWFSNNNIIVTDLIEEE